MTTSTEVPTVPGTPFGGGFYVGRFQVGGQQYALIVAPKGEGEHDETPWHEKYDIVEGARSYCDGMANTEAMLAAGSKLARQIRGLRIGGFDDWYLPSQDELEPCYRYLKPTKGENWLYARSGINVSAIPPTYPYTESSPTQTEAADFQEGGAQAFDKAWYWSSTQHAGGDAYAWVQGFGDGDQDDSHKGNVWRARAVRRLAI